MTAESMPVSLIRNLQTSSKHALAKGYFRSKLFIAPYTTNPIVAAAGPLFSLLERLCVTPTLPPLSGIRENIEHELKAFHSRLKNDYAEEFIAIADYLISAAIDELLAKNYLRLHGTLAEFHAFTPITQGEIGPEEHFFTLVNALKDSPTQYIDLLELAYYCLITGFEGKYHRLAEGRLVLDELIDELYHLIRLYRVNKPSDLLKEARKLEEPAKNSKSLWAVGLTTAFLIMSSVVFSYSFLLKKAETIQFRHPILAQLDD